jgi:hypothetical protein
VGGGGGLASFSFSRVVRAADGRLRVSPVRHQGREATPAWAQLRVRAPARWAAAPSACTVQVTARYGPQWTTVGQAFANVGAQVAFSLAAASSPSWAWPTRHGRRGTYSRRTLAVAATRRSGSRPAPGRSARTRPGSGSPSWSRPAATWRDGAAHRFLVAATGFWRGQDAATPKPPRAVLRAVLRGSAYTLFGTTAVTWGAGVRIQKPGSPSPRRPVRAQRVGDVPVQPGLRLCGTVGRPAAIPATGRPGGRLTGRARAPRGPTVRSCCA